MSFNKCEDSINTFSCNAIAKTSDGSPFTPASADSALGLFLCERVMEKVNEFQGLHLLNVNKNQ